MFNHVHEMETESLAARQVHNYGCGRRRSVLHSSHRLRPQAAALLRKYLR